MHDEISDGDLVRLARADDPVAFGLLVERYRPMALARARSLCGDTDAVDDIVQDAFVQAFVALDRLRDPDRFAGWLSGIVGNVHRAAHRRRASLVLVDEWPQALHPVSADGQPESTVDDLDRAQVLRSALADLPAQQREAVAFFYYADLPIEQVADRLADTPGAVKARLHKARRRLREHIAAYRPDLIPYPPRRTLMTTVRIAHAEPLPDKIHVHRVLIVLADDAGHRALPIWLTGFDWRSLRLLLDRPPGAAEPAGVPEELTGRLLHAAGVAVTGVDIDELGPEVPAARIGLRGPGGTRQVTARLVDALVLAVAQGAPIRVADALMDRLAEPAPDGDLLTPFLDRRPVPAPAARRRRRPHNLAFTHGLHGWDLRGSFLRGPTAWHWQDYTCTATPERSAVLAAAVPEPYGFADLRQAILAHRYRGHTVSFRGELRTDEVRDQAGLYLRIVTQETARSGIDQRTLTLVETNRAWTRHEVRTQVPDDAAYVLFGITLTGRGRIELRNAQVTRDS